MTIASTASIERLLLVADLMLLSVSVLLFLVLLRLADVQLIVNNFKRDHLQSAIDLHQILVDYVGRQSVERYNGPQPGRPGGLMEAPPQSPVTSLPGGETPEQWLDRQRQRMRG